MSEGKIVVQFGAMADPLRLQLRAQGFNLGSRDLGHLQRDVDAISRLLVRGLINSSAATSARKKTLAKILKLAATVKP